MNAFSATSKPFRGLGTALIAGGLLLACGSARADIKYTKVMKMGEGDDQKTMSQSTTYVKNGLERTETTTEFGPAKMVDIALTLCEKRQNVRLNPDAKVYTISSMDGNKPSSTSDKNTGGTPTKSNGKKTGKIIMTVTVKDLGEETIATFKTRHYMITSKMQMTGCAGDSTVDTKIEIWVADIRDAVACKDTSPGDYHSMMAQGQNDCDIAFEMKGDSDAYSKAYNGLVMRMKMYQGDKVSMIQEVTMLSQAKLEDAPFTIPTDYREVSAEEFQKLQSEAMMKAVMNQAKNGGNNNDANDEGDKNGNDDAGNKDDANKDDGNNDDGNKDNDEDKQEEQPKKKKRKLGGLKLPF